MTTRHSTTKPSIRRRLRFAGAATSLTLLALLGVATPAQSATPLPSSPAAKEPAHRVGSYSNAAIADVALRYVGRYGGAACVDAGRSGYTGGAPLGSGNNNDGECRAFVNCVVKIASGGTQWLGGGGGDYFNRFEAVGGSRVTDSAALVKGDVVQIGRYGTHTTIIVGRVSGTTYDVVDSNHLSDHVVRTYRRTVALSDTTRAYRLGTVQSGPPPTTDSDGDGVADSADLLPYVPGTPRNRGVPVTGGRATGDFNGDGYADVAAFYDYGSARTGLWLFRGSASGLTSPAMAWDSGPGNWEWQRVKAVAGDANGDGRADIATFYDYDRAQTKVWVFKGTSTGLSTPTLTWDSGPGNWEWARIAPVAGDFNGDGYADIGAFYDYGSARTGLWLFRGSASGLTSPAMAWDSGPGNWEWQRVKAVAGDANGDGRVDIEVLYDYGSARVGVWLFRGSASGITSPVMAWDSGPGNWEWARTLPVAGDFNGDGYADVAAFYDYGSARTGLFTFRGSTNGITSPTIGWDSGPGNWEVRRLRPVTADFNGDGRGDIATFYDYGSARTAIWVFPGRTSGSGAPVMGWDSGPGNWEWFRVLTS